MGLHIKDKVNNLLRLYQEHGGFHDEENKLRKEFYQVSEEKSHYLLVFMVDGRSVHGGLADRLKGICTLYEYSKQQGIPFRINFTYPFLLQDYLEPNKYDWTLKEGELAYNLNDCKPVLLNTHQFPRRLHTCYLERMICKYRQLHLYSNSDIFNNKFHQNFHELFKLSDQLAKDIQVNLDAIGGNFVSITYRFQQLLGDFKERDYKILSADEKKKLIEDSLKVIENVHKKYPQFKVLVTSDSTFFLKTANKYDYVYIIPGNVVHMDYTSDADFRTYEKSFIDLLTLSHASKIFLAYSGQMYKSGFAYCASLIGNVEYEEIKY